MDIESKPPITFEATLFKITTTVDGGWRVSFDLSHWDIQGIQELSKDRNSVFQVACVPVRQLED